MDNLKKTLHMEINLEHERTTEDVDEEDLKFYFNFINEPWDNRSKISKIGMVSLLLSIFIVTIGVVVNNLVIHYRGFDPASFYSNFEIDCNLVKLDDYGYAARIHSVSSDELICIGAVVSSTSILANDLCIKSGPIKIRLGSPIHPQCKKGFSIDAIDSIPHDGVITKSLVLLTSFENMKPCIKQIKIGGSLNPKIELFIIGRPFRGGRALSFQIAKYDHENVTTVDPSPNFNINKTICVQTLGKCPVRAGDLLVQEERLLGLASTSVHRREKSNTVCFANLSVVDKELKLLDVEVENNRL